MTVTNDNGEIFTVRTEQLGNEQPKVVDFSKVPDVKKPEIFTTSFVNPVNGVLSTHTNDVKTMNEEKTFPKTIDTLEKQKSLTKNGFTIDSEVVSKYQRSVEHHIKFVNQDTKEIVDFRVLADSRNGQVTIVEEQKSTITKDGVQKMPSEKEYL